MLYANSRVSTFAIRLVQGAVPMNVMMGAKLLRADSRTPPIGLALQVLIAALAVGTIAGFPFYLFDVAFAGIAIAVVVALIQLSFETVEHSGARRSAEAAGTRIRS